MVYDVVHTTCAHENYEYQWICAATFSLPLYYSANGDEEKVDQIKAITYNLENGVANETPLK